MTLFQNISRVRITTWVAVLAGAGGAVWSAAFTKTSWHLEPIQLMGFGFVALAVVNIVVFVINLCLSMPKWSRAENDQELEQVARSALQGESTEMGMAARQVVGVLTAACIGVIAGGVCAGIASSYGSLASRVLSVFRSQQPYGFSRMESTPLGIEPSHNDQTTINTEAIMSEEKWLDGYSWQTTDELIGLSVTSDTTNPRETLQVPCLSSSRRTKIGSRSGDRPNSK